MKKKILELIDAKISETRTLAYELSEVHAAEFEKFQLIHDRMMAFPGKTFEPDYVDMETEARALGKKIDAVFAKCSPLWTEIRAMNVVREIVENTKEDAS